MKSTIGVNDTLIVWRELETRKAGVNQSDEANDEILAKYHSYTFVGLNPVEKTQEERPSWVWSSIQTRSPTLLDGLYV